MLCAAILLRFILKLYFLQLRFISKDTGLIFLEDSRAILTKIHSISRSARYLMKNVYIEITNTLQCHDKTCCVSIIIQSYCFDF